MALLLTAIAILFATGLAGFFVNHRPRLVTAIATGGAVAACVIGLIPSVRALFGADLGSVRLPWHVPGGAFFVQADALSAFFLIPIFVLTAAAAIYGGEYMLAFGKTRSLAPPWFFFNLFIAGMVLVVIARNAVLFLVAWEIMSIAAFFLVTFEHEKRDVRIAGWIYLVAAHLGVGCLLAMFIALGRHAGSFDFDHIIAAGNFAPTTGAIVFALALVGFGIKAGLVPMHIWLPEAHPAAPSHVSALMSGVMIKLGIYGILRTTLLLGNPPAWCGPMLAIIGLATGAIGVSLALIQRDIKRSLAYSSIENIGLIVLALGVGLWGAANGHTLVAVLGLAGGLLHIWNHALMKGLMFLCAGSILHGSGTKDMEKLGGLMKRMPETGLLMAVGAVAMSALPPMNGFVSEWLMYMGMLRGGLEFSGIGRIVLLFGVGILAFIGGLALICFVRLIGIVLLGEPRSDESRHAHESSRRMVLPIAVLVALCVLSALFPRAIAMAFSGVIAQISAIPSAKFVATIRSSDSPIATLGLLNGFIWIVIAWVAFTLIFLRRRAPESADSTWGCGYLAPTSRMQYTGQSFTELIVTRMFPRSLRPRTSVTAPRGNFPAATALASEYPDPFSRRIFRPFFERWATRFARLRWLQQGKLHIYLLYFVIVLIVAFAWLVLRRWIMP